MYVCLPSCDLEGLDLHSHARSCNHACKSECCQMLPVHVQALAVGFPEGIFACLSCHSSAFFRMQHAAFCLRCSVHACGNSPSPSHCSCFGRALKKCAAAWCLPTANLAVACNYLVISDLSLCRAGQLGRRSSRLVFAVAIQTCQIADCRDEGKLRPSHVARGPLADPLLRD